jgi:MYXO-CTERM domain-containing protein
LGKRRFLGNRPAVFGLISAALKRAIRRSAVAILSREGNVSVHSINEGTARDTRIARNAREKSAMKMTAALCGMGVAAAAFWTAPASAALSLTDPGLIDGGASSFVSARMRLDNDNSPTWKNAILNDTGNIGSPANIFGANSITPLYDSGVTYDWTISFTAGSGAISLEVFDGGSVVESLSGFSTVPSGEDLLAIRIDGSAPGGGRVVATIDSYNFAGAPGSIPYLYDNDFLSSPASTRQFQVGSPLFLADLLNAGETLTINGTFVFDYLGSNPNGQKDERTGIDVRLFAGNAIPSPGVLAAMGLAGVASARRRRN